MALNFSGTIGRSTQFYIRQGVGAQALSTWRMVGAVFTVAVQTQIYSATTAYGTTAAGVRIGLWDDGGTELASGVSYNYTGNVTPAYLKPVLLFPGQNYILGMQVDPGNYSALPGLALVEDRYPFNFINTAFDDDQTEFTAPTTSDPATLADLRMYASIVATYEDNTTQVIPPEPLIIPGGLAFQVYLRSSLMPQDAREWDIQYAKSPDGAVFEDWKNLGTYPIDATTIPHSNLDPYVKPFYRYRYRVRTSLEESLWSEEAYAGQVRASLPADEAGNFDASTLADSAIPASALNVSALSVITGNVGLLTGGIIRGLTVENQAAHPKTVFDSLGLYATKADASKSSFVRSKDVVTFNTTGVTTTNVTFPFDFNVLQGFVNFNCYGSVTGVYNINVQFDGITVATARVWVDVINKYIFTSAAFTYQALVLPAVKAAGTYAISLVLPTNVLIQTDNIFTGMLIASKDI